MNEAEHSVNAGRDANARHSKLDRRLIRRHFDAASRAYDAHASLQSGARAELLERLDFFRLEPRCVLDLGCGTGAASVALRRRYPRAAVLALDLSPAMLREALRRCWPWRRFQRVCASAEALPLPAHSVDLLYCNLMLQWCEQPAKVFSEWQRVLRPGGLALFCSFGPETLRELRAAWAAADASPHVSAFMEPASLAGALQTAGLSEPVLDVDLRVEFHTDLDHLMHGVRSIGAHNALLDRRRGLTTPRQLQRVRAHYERERGEGGLPATWELIFGAVFAGDHDRGHGVAAEALVPVSAIGRRSP